MSDWRYPTERGELVERLIRAERAARVAEMRCRALQEADDFTTLLATRIVELEDIVSRQNATIERLNRKAAS